MIARASQKRIRMIEKNKKMRVLDDIIFLVGSLMFGACLNNAPAQDKEDALEVPLSPSLLLLNEEKKRRCRRRENGEDNTD